MSVEVKVPSVGESVTEVYIGQWRKAEGDSIARDEDLVELESEKATFEVPSPSAGTLTKILKKPGDAAEVGEVIAYIDVSADGKSATQATAKVEPEQKAAKPSGSDGVATGAKKESKKEEASPADGTPAVTPAVRRLLEEHGLSPQDVEATGPGGRILKEDVLRVVDKPSSSSYEPPRQDEMISTEAQGNLGRRDEIVPMSPLRRRIARRLVKAQQEAALLTTFNEVDMSAVIALRKRYATDFQEKFGVKLGFMSFFVKASIDALMRLPQLNAEVRGNDIVYHSYYDIGVAVATDGGLVVPVLRNAELLSFSEIEVAIDQLARKAREGRLSIEELQGGTFTISNGGVYGSLMSTPIVNPPQSGVLGMHSIQDRAVVRDGQIVARPMMYVALSYDHRLVDGREAVTFLKRVKDLVEDPTRLLLEA